jgi:glycosyltransferase involved in cell wall biosynthesis
MKISVLVCTHNEDDYIRQLLTKLTSFIQQDKSGVEWEIVVIDDESTNLETVNVLNEFAEQNLIQLHSHKFMGHYADHKNFANKQCTGDWILNLDADEYVTDDFLGFIPLIIDNNPTVDAYAVPRLNTVDGLTLDHVRKWGWIITQMEELRSIKELDSKSAEYELLKQYQYIINEENSIVTYYVPVVMWPDYQYRLYKRTPNIKWINKVHERLTGYEQFAVFPQEKSLAIVHHKEIVRQEKQNAFYETL